MDENNSNNDLENQETEDINEVRNVEINNTEVNNTKEVRKTKEVKEKVKYVDKKDNNKRNGDKNIVVQYRKPSIFSSLLLILIGVMLATIVFLVLYIFKENKPVDVYKEPDNVVEEETPKEEEKVKLNLEIEGDFVQNLYKKIPMQIRGYEPYFSTKTTASSIENNNKLLFVIRALEKENKHQVITDLTNIKSKLDNKVISSYELNEVKKFDFEIVKAKYQSVFGYVNEMPLIDAETGLGYVYEYVSEDNCFYGHSYAGGGGSDFRYQAKIYNCEQNEDGTEVYIYDNFIAFDYDHNNYISSPNTYALYGSSDAKKIIVDRMQKSYDGSKALYNGQTFEQLMENYESQASKYKHTYKLDTNGEYYWYSSEPIQ